MTAVSVEALNERKWLWNELERSGMTKDRNKSMIDGSGVNEESMDWAREECSESGGVEIVTEGCVAMQEVEWPNKKKKTKVSMK